MPSGLQTLAGRVVQPRHNLSLAAKSFLTALFAVRSFLPRCGRGHYTRRGSQCCSCICLRWQLLGARPIVVEFIGNFRLQTGGNLHLEVILVDFRSHSRDFRDRLEIARVIPSWDGAPTRGSRANHLQVVRQICYKRSIRPCVRAREIEDDNAPAMGKERRWFERAHA